MKTQSLTATILVSILLLSIPSCSQVKSPSTFLTSFSLSETIKRMNMQEINVTSHDASGTASAGNPSSHRRDFDVMIDITDPAADSFNEKRFLDRLEQLIAQEVQSGESRFPVAAAPTTVFIWTTKAASIMAALKSLESALIKIGIGSGA